jgi:glycosyltransferase involved in cell wall biosynthesis
LSEWSLRTVDAETPIPEDAGPAAFQRRRDANVGRLASVGRLVAQSPRVAEVYRARGVPDERMSTLPFTLAHIERLRPRSLTAPPAPVTFATLGGCATRTKGAHLVTEALRALRGKGLEGRFRLLVYGAVHDEVRAELERFAGVEIPELYDRDELDGLLEGVDVGLMPSVWEEAFGYTGLEMIAKGIPLIANPLGGIVEYAREGETAWLNASCSAEGLADLMAALVAEPQRVVDMHHRVIAARDRLIRPLDEHVDAIDAIYAGCRT